MTLFIALVASAFAADYQPILRGPGFMMVAPVAWSHTRAVAPPTDVTGDAGGFGMGMNMSIAGMIRSRHDGLYFQDCIGADFDTGRQSGLMYGGGELWGRVRFEFGVALVAESDDTDAWVRLGAYSGMDTARTSDFGQASEQGWRFAVGARSGGFSLELAPPLGAADRSMMLRSFVAVSDTIALGLEAERIVERHLNQRTATRRLQLMIRIF